MGKHTKEPGDRPGDDPGGVSAGVPNGVGGVPTAGVSTPAHPSDGSSELAADSAADRADDAAPGGDEDGETDEQRLAKQRRARRRRLMEWPIVIVTAIVVALLVRTFVFETFYIPSLSMANTLKVNDRVVVNKLSYTFHSIHRGDVVVFSKPANLQLNDKDLIKRVIGLPGDTLSLHGNSVYVDGAKLTEPYIDSDCDGTASTAGPYGLEAPFTVPKGDIFVMGDNRCESYDSRYFGPISEKLVVGHAFVRVWPLGRLGTL